LAWLCGGIGKAGAPFSCRRSEKFLCAGILEKDLLKKTEKLPKNLKKFHRGLYFFIFFYKL